MTKKLTIDNVKEGYRNLWDNMEITRKAAVNNAARKIINLRHRYQIIEDETGVPWCMIGALHMRESNNDFRGVLHNGEHIIGTGRKTRSAPKERGPFRSWEEAAVDALKIKKLDKIDDWCIERVLWECERFNGLGYFNLGINSPYIWAGSNHYKRGKFVRDGVFSRTAVDKQLGVAPVMKRILEITNASTIPGSRSHWSTKFGKWVGIGGGGLGAIVSQFTGFITDWRTLSLALLVAIIAGIWFWYLERRRLKEYREGRYIPSGEESEDVLA